MSRHWVIVEPAAELRFWSDEGWVSDVQEAKLYSEQEKLETFNPVGGLWKLAVLPESLVARIHWRNLSLAEQEKFAKLSIGSELSAVQLAYLSDVKRKERRSVKHED